MSFQANREVITVTLKRAKLSFPINEAFPHWRPFLFALPCDIFAMAVADAVLRQQIVTVRIWLLTIRGSIAWVPVQHEVRRLHCFQHLGSVRTCRGVQATVVF